MAGVFDFKKGAFDSTEAALLHEAYEIAVHGLEASHGIDRLVAARLARSIVKVVRAEPDCLRNDGTIDPARLAQRAILRMLQMSAPKIGIAVKPEGVAPRPRIRAPDVAGETNPMPLENPGLGESPGRVESPGKVMLRLFERTPFAKV